GGDPLIAGPRSERLLELAREGAVVLDPLLRRPEAIVVDKLGHAERLARDRPESVRRADVHPAAVGALERLVGAAAGALRLGYLARAPVLGGAPGEPRDRRVEQRRLDVLAATARDAVVERRDDAERAVHPSAHVADRCP